jgi:hypothetical protein
MSIKKHSIFNDVSNAAHRWNATITALSAQHSSICLDMNYHGDVVNCPVCGRDVKIVSTRIVAVDVPDTFDGVGTKIFVHLPVFNGHNVGCKVDLDPTILTNTLLLDVIINQVGNSDKHHPLLYLLNAETIT